MKMKHLGLAFIVGILGVAGITNVALAQNSTQQNELLVEIAKMTPDEQKAALNKLRSNDISNVSVAKEWVEIGSGIGQGMAATAKEMGVAVNEFAATPVGKFTMIIIAWHFFGDAVTEIVVHFFGGGLFLSIAWIIAWMFLRRIYGEYDDKGKFIKFDTHQMTNMNPEWAVATCVGLAIITAIGLCVMFG